MLRRTVARTDLMLAANDETGAVLFHEQAKRRIGVFLHRRQRDRMREAKVP